MLRMIAPLAALAMVATPALAASSQTRTTVSKTTKAPHKHAAKKTVKAKTTTTTAQ